MKNNLVTTKQRHDYYNSIYGDLHPHNNKDTRIYTKQKENFGISYTGEKVIHSPNREMIFSQKSIDNFKSFKKENFNIERKSPQERITFYLTNNIVPGFNHNSYDNYKKEKRFASPEIQSRKSYLVDKWYFYKKDDLTSYYEKFFMDKVFLIENIFMFNFQEVDKMRKKNAREKK